MTSLPENRVVTLLDGINSMSLQTLLSLNGGIINYYLVLIRLVRLSLLLGKLHSIQNNSSKFSKYIKMMRTKTVVNLERFMTIMHST